MRQRLQNVPVVVGANRYEAGRLAEERGLGDIFLLDDGYRFSDWEAGFLVSHATLVEHAHRVADGHVDPSKTDSFSAQFVSGTYGILCVPLRNGQEYGIGYTAGPITVR